MKTLAMKTRFAIAAIAVVLLLSACGNKGPLVKPSQIPPPVDGGNG